jgi:GT2 family glycosyltransferase
LKAVILIINWNSIIDTLDCVKSIKDDAEILILDNNSNNFEGEQLNSHFDKDNQVSVFLSAENMGFAKGCNFIFEKALKKTNPDFFLLLNNDAIAEGNWSINLINCAWQTQSSLITSKMVQMDNPALLDNVGHTFLNTGEVLPTGHGLFKQEFNLRTKTIGACGGACLISKELYQKIGGYDEHFFVGYEDAEYGLRAFLTGHDIYFEPTAIVHHKMGASIKKIFDYNYTLTQFRNINYTVLKLMPFSYLFINLPFYFFKTLMVFMMNLIFLRGKFLKVMLHSYWLLFTKDWKIAMKARKKFYRNNQVIRTVFEIQKQTTFFLWFDIKRFWKFIVLREKNQFEKY